MPTGYQGSSSLQDCVWAKQEFSNCRIISLEGCVGFCCIITWISCKYTYVPSLLNLSPCPHPIPLSHHRILSLAPCVILQFLISYFTHSIVYVLMLLSQFIPLSPSPAVSISLFSMSVSPFLPCKWVYQYSFYRSYIYIYIYMHSYTISIFLWLTSLCIADSSFIHISSTDSNSFLLKAE